VARLGHLVATAGPFGCAMALVAGCGQTPDLFGDHTTTDGSGGAGGTGGGGTGGGGGGVVRVAVMDGTMATDDLRAYLDGQPDIEAEMLNACILGELMNFDVVVVHGQMACFESDDFDTYVVNGGGLIGVPWIHDYGELIALPVVPDVVHKETGSPLEIFAVEPDDPLLQNVAFHDGDVVGYERGALPHRPEAVVSARWGDSSNTSAVVRWVKGGGRSVYLNFLYVHSCCPSAVDYDWGKQLVRNAVRWAAGD